MNRPQSTDIEMEMWILEQGAKLGICAVKDSTGRLHASLKLVGQSNSTKAHMIEEHVKANRGHIKRVG